jgi:hypothetical protein
MWMNPCLATKSQAPSAALVLRCARLKSPTHPLPSPPLMTRASLGRALPPRARPPCEDVSRDASGRSMFGKKMSLFLL